MLQKKTIKIWDINVDNTVTKKLVQRKTNLKYLIGCLDKAIRPLVLIIPKMSGHIKTFQVKDGDKDKNNKLVYFHGDGQELLEKYIAIQTKIEDVKSIELNALAIYDERYIKTKIRTYERNNMSKGVDPTKSNRGKELS